MSDKISYSTCVDDDEPILRAILSHAFGSEPELIGEWIQTACIEHFRIRRTDGTPDACLLEAPMGLFAGSRSVPLIGIAGVGVAPTARGRGVATDLMRRFLRDAHSRGAPLSALFASTEALYRKVGYERAAYWCEHAFHPGQVGIRDHSLRVIPVEDAEGEQACREVYTRAWRHQTGQLDRGPYCWERAFRPKGLALPGFLAVGDNGPEGYIYFKQNEIPGDAGFKELFITDVCPATPAAGRVLLSFLREHATMARRARFTGGPSHPMLLLLDELQIVQTKLREHAFLRIVNPTTALEARGWPAGIETDVHFAFSDDVIDENNGPLVLSVSNRRATVRAGGRGDIEMTTRDLAALYTGYATATMLRASGRLSGPDEPVALADTLFSGPTPWMTDMF